MNKWTLIVVALLIILTISGVSFFLLNKDLEENNPFEDVSNSKNSLIKIESGGGRCFDGPCYSKLIIFEDGSYNLSDSNKQVKIGNIDFTNLSELKQLIDTSNFDDIKSRIFTGTCPTAYDGPVNVYTFFFDDSLESISDCKYELNYSTGLFAKVTDIRENLNS